MELSFTNLLIVSAIAFAAPLTLGFAPAVRIPAIVLEIVAGIVVGPSGFGWVEIDAPVAVMSVIGLGYLLFLAGLEVEFDKLRGRVLRTTTLGFVVSFAIAIVVGLVLDAGGLAGEPLFIAIVLSATSLGVLVPVLEDAGESSTTFGQLVIAAGTIADFATVILLSLFFSREAASVTTKVILLGGLFVVAMLLALTIARVEHSMRLSAVLRRLQDTTAARSTSADDIRDADACVLAALLRRRGRVCGDPRLRRRSGARACARTALRLAVRDDAAARKRILRLRDELCPRLRLGERAPERRVIRRVAVRVARVGGKGLGPRSVHRDAPLASRRDGVGSGHPEHSSRRQRRDRDRERGQPRSHCCSFPAGSAHLR